jgi:hypothetical protein
MVIGIVPQKHLSQCLFELDEFDEFEHLEKLTQSH